MIIFRGESVQVVVNNTRGSIVMHTIDHPLKENLFTPPSLAGRKTEARKA